MDKLELGVDRMFGVTEAASLGWCEVPWEGRCQGEVTWGLSDSAGEWVEWCEGAGLARGRAGLALGSAGLARGRAGLDWGEFFLLSVSSIPFMPIDRGGRLFGDSFF